MKEVADSRVVAIAINYFALEVPLRMFQLPLDVRELGVNSSSLACLALENLVFKTFLGIKESVQGIGPVAR